MHAATESGINYNMWILNFVIGLLLLFREINSCVYMNTGAYGSRQTLWILR